MNLVSFILITSIKSRYLINNSKLFACCLHSKVNVLRLVGFGLKEMSERCTLVTTPVEFGRIVL